MTDQQQDQQDQQEQEPEILVWFDPVRCDLVIQNGKAEIRLDYYQRRLLVGALSNHHTAPAVLHRDEVMAVGQNLLAVWANQQEPQA